MRLLAAPVLLLAATSALAQPSDRPAGRPEGRGPRFYYANPSAVIAADIALGRVAREKGEARALRDQAGPGAVIFAPRPVDAAAWLKQRRGDSATPRRWQPREVWMSCDGGHAVSRGVWTRGEASGDYVAVWERQPKKGEWKWLVRDEGPAGAESEAPEMISARVAECAGLARRRPGEEAPPRDAAAATSRDRSLKWSVVLGADCARNLSVHLWDGQALAPVLSVRRGAPADGCS